MQRLRQFNPAMLAVLLAATLWGTLGVYYEIVDRHVDVDRLTVVTLRATGATIVLVLWWNWRDRSVFCVGRRDLPIFVAMGLASVTAFYIFLIYTFVYTSVAVGTLLLYMAPAFVTIGAACFLGERLTRSKIVALLVSFVGCALVVEITRPGAISGNAKGILLGLASAICYASYSLMAKPMLTRYRGATIQTVHMIFGSVALLLVKLIVSPGDWPSILQVVVLSLVGGIAISVVPVALYTYGLSNLPSSEASILATWEPVVAVLLAAIVLDERLGAVQTVGACLVVAAVVILGRSTSSRRAEVIVEP